MIGMLNLLLHHTLALQFSSTSQLVVVYASRIDDKSHVLCHTLAPKLLSTST